MTQVLSAAPAISRPVPVKPLYLPEKFTPYRFTMSGTFPVPDLPRDNPLIEERVALGKALFQRNRPLARRHAVVRLLPRLTDPPSPTRAATASASAGRPADATPCRCSTSPGRSSFFWDGRAPSLRAQALMPIQDHTEMDESLTNVVAKLAAN